MNAMTKPSLIGTCRWQTVSVEAAQNVQLQNFISDWSRQSLAGVFEAACEQCFGQREHWRIDLLDVDLGKIYEQDFQAELPKRLRNALIDAFQRLLTEAARGATGHDKALRDDEPLALLEVFLLTGQVPWWWRREVELAETARQSLTSDSKVFTTLIKRIGVQAPVRQRIVWQLGVPFVDDLVRALEPSRADYIIAFANEVTLSKAVPSVRRRSIHQDVREWILQHLLVERGSLFNTLSFVRSTLQQMAASLNLSFESVLDEMWQATQLLQDSPRHQPVFLQAISMIQLEVATRNPLKPRTNVAEVPNWDAVFKALIAADTLVTGTIYSPADWFEHLALENPSAARVWLLSHGTNEAFRSALIQQFNHFQFDVVIQVVEPAEASFIQSHLRLMSKPRRPEHMSQRKVVQEIILAFLLTRGQSHFQRRQFVASTVAKVAERQGLDIVELLTWLTKDTEYLGYQHRYAMLSILLDIRTRQCQRESRQTAASRALTMLTNSEASLYELSRGLFAALDQTPELLIRLLQTDRAPEKFARRLAELPHHISLRIALNLTTDKQLQLLLPGLVTRLQRPAIAQLLAELLRHRTLRASSFQRLRAALRMTNKSFKLLMTELHGNHALVAGYEDFQRVHRTDFQPEDFQSGYQAEDRQDARGKVEGSFHKRAESFQMGNNDAASWRYVWAWLRECTSDSPDCTVILERLHTHWHALGQRDQELSRLWLLPALRQALSQTGLNLLHDLETQLYELTRRHDLGIVLSIPERQSQGLKVGAEAELKRELKVESTSEAVIELRRPGRKTSDLLDEMLDQGIAVSNAGLVLAQSFIPTLFERLGLNRENAFVSAEAQRQAVLQLHYLATGQTLVAEHQLVLSKLLAGLPLTEPVGSELSLEKVNSELVDGLIKAMISHWPASGAASVEGFRGNWLVRAGVLHKSDDHWSLIVEKQSYDILLSSGPFSYSIVNLPWMTAPLYVTWAP